MTSIIHQESQSHWFTIVEARSEHPRAQYMYRFRALNKAAAAAHARHVLGLRDYAVYSGWIGFITPQHTPLDVGED